MAESEDYQSEKDRVLPKKKLKSLIERLSGTDRAKLMDFVRKEVDSGYHLKHFPERLAFWKACVETGAIEAFTLALFDHYLKLLRTLKGREKYSSLLVKWMDFIRDILHKLSTDTDAAIQWDAGVKKTALIPSISTKTAIVSSLARAVFTFSQQTMVSLKEGDCDYQEEEETDDDVVQETGLSADEASLHRLGGFALYALIKAHQESSKADLLSVLKNIRMPLAEKAVDLPSNIQHLDKGGMTFMKKEMLGYLGMVYQKIRARSTKEFFNTHGAQSMKVMETELKGDEQLRRNFVFSCGEIGIPESGILKEIHEKLLERMLHTHGNELVQNRRMLTNLQEGRVDAPLMLRDSLKVVAATNSRQLLLPDL